MNKLMSRLEKLQDFVKRDHALKARAKAIEIEAEGLGNEFREYMHTEFGLPNDRGLHLSEVLKVALETSHDITPY